MGLIGMCDIRQYWEIDSNYELVSSVMPQNGFQQLLNLFHFVNNITIQECRMMTKKINSGRPWLTRKRENCLKTIPEKHCSIDEMTWQYTRQRSSIRQYIKSKPHPWGFKI